MLIKANKAARGFSLIELMMAVALFGILATLGASSYNVWIENTRIRNAAESIQTGLQKARMEALKRNASVEFVLGANSSWTIGCETVTANCPDPIESRSMSEGSSADVNVVATPAGSTTVVFTSLGRIGGVAPFTRLDIDNSKLSATDSRDLRVLLDAGGNSRMCDPYTGLSPTDPRKCP